MVSRILVYTPLVPRWFPVGNIPVDTRKVEGMRISSFGAVEKRASGRWRARYVHPTRPYKEDGARNYIAAPTTFATKTAARDWLSGIQSDIARGAWKSPEQVEAERLEAERAAALAARTFGSYAEGWMESRPLTPATRRAYQSSLRTHLLPQWGNTPLQAITTPAVREWLANLAPGRPGARKKSFELFKTILNTAVAKELKGYADELEKADDFTSAAIALVKRTIRDHRRVIFNGNGYTAEWEEEAAKRGLPNKKNTPAALPALIEPKNIALMEDFGVLTKVEMESRYEVEMEHYSKIINIEALTMLEMARKQLLPAVNAYMSEVANTAASKLAVSESISVRSETKTLTKLSADADAMSDAVDTLQDAVDASKALPTEAEKAVAFHDNVLPAMDALRAAADDAETICGEDYWPLPSYSKMLYYV